ncbi:MAG: hypothetical protein C4534_07790 [Gaiellales bacterium]|nr:MAG: hypothetical protein C4534_07790 [Gaiellales bacterium]
MRFLVENLDGGGAALLPEECRACGWWQGFDDGWSDLDAGSWMEAAGDETGFWGKVATGDGELLGFIQFGPAGLYPRAREIAGRDIRDSFLLACGMVAVEGFDSIRKSLLMAAVAELKELEVEQLDAFCHSADGGDCRLFDRRFLGDCGFYPVKDLGGLTMMRLELGGAETGRSQREGAGRRLLERLKHAQAAPSPASMCQRTRRKAGVIAGH